MVIDSDPHARNNIKDTTIDEPYSHGQNTMSAKVEALVSFSPKRMKDTSHPGAEAEFTAQRVKTAAPEQLPAWDPLFIGKPMMIDGVLVEDYVASQDLNECVDALLKKGIKHS